ncbi:LOW QUALITY PROTEIN: tubulin polyglutamylase ttll6 [Denticeps clupeoides]|uniref:LOW QUALITY PROTEIN: tubulin polyglutamylase ttll6 n=1 Tax=Denticeps clupeoides TaxID=299321 RepID=UPI0010A54E05|nr:LOW QUALITY PROTEIN: tubulin polyglutamylase TTLL6 [Denticeps clupeoides]
MGLTAQGSDRPAENGVPRSDPNPREEGEGWGSDSHPDASSPGPPDPGVKRRKRRKKRLWINLANCKYESVRRAARRYGLREAAEGDDWTLFWTDCSVSLDRVMDMKRYQKINHFPGMSEICRKDLLARNMNRMLKLFPKDYNVFPRTWCLPADYSDFQAFTRVKKHKTFICKPDSGCQGRGIFLTRSSRDIRSGEHMICQVYVSRPFIIDGFKFDLRLYVLVTSCDPFRIFMYNEGLARFCTSQYNEPTNSNVEDVCMHLTNYAINKNSENFVRDDDTGSKRKLSTFNKHLEALGFDVEKLWCDIEDVVVKTLISAHPVLKHNYNTCFPHHTSGSACFEILGFDVLLDHRLKPWLLEVNHSPSFTTDSRLDREVKDGLLYDTLVLINLGACGPRKITEEEKRRVKERLQQTRTREARVEELRQCQAAGVEQMLHYEDRHLGGFHRIFPRNGGEKYDKYFQHSGSLFQDTAASRAREESARQQLQELRLKREHKGGGRRDRMEGESAGERPKPRPRGRRGVRPTHTEHAPQQQPVRLDPPGDTGLDLSEGDEMQRISELVQRENLLRDMGVVDQVYQMLSAERPGEELQDQKQLGGTLGRRLPLGSTPCIPALHPSLLKQPWPWPALKGGPEERRAPIELWRSSSTHRLPSTFSSCPLGRRCSLSSSQTDARARVVLTSVPQLLTGRVQCAPLTSDPKSQGLFIISSPAPMVPRPSLPHGAHRGPRQPTQLQQGR